MKKAAVATPHLSLKEAKELRGWFGTMGDRMKENVKAWLQNMPSQR